MSSTRYKVPYHNFLGYDHSRTNGYLFVYEHNTSGVNCIFNEHGEEIFTWGGDCEGNQAILIANIILGNEVEKAEFEDGELEQLDQWMFPGRRQSK